MSELVLLAVDEGVATLSFNRPQVFNAMDAEMMIQFRAAAEQVQRDSAVRAVVLRGEEAFLAGGGVGLFHQRIQELPDMIVRWGREMHFTILALRRADKPVLASVHGACAGAGFSICAADLAVAADNAYFSLAYTKIGASPDGGSTHFLPRLVGYKKAMELTLLADRFDANKARDLGLVNWVVPAADLEAETRKLAERLREAPPIAVAAAKRLMNQSLDRSIDTQMEEELAAFARCARTHDLAEVWLHSSRSANLHSKANDLRLGRARPTQDERTWDKRRIDEAGFCIGPLAMKRQNNALVARQDYSSLQAGASPCHRCAAREGANIVIAAKSAEPHPKLGARSTASRRRWKRRAVARLQVHSRRGGGGSGCPAGGQTFGGIDAR